MSSLSQSSPDSSHLDAAGNASSIPSLRYFPETSNWLVADLKELLAYRELLWMFFLRDIKIRYRQVFIGLLWVLLQPTLGMAIFLAIFWLVDGKPTDATNRYASTASVIYVGMLLWQFVAASLRDATGSLVNYRHVITKIAFPRLLLPLSSVLCAGFDLVIASTLLPVVVYLSGDQINWLTIWLTPIVVFSLGVFVVGCVAWLSSLNAFYRDVGYALPFVLQIGMFLSPVIYDSSKIQLSDRIPSIVKMLYQANPISNAIGWARAFVLGGPSPAASSTFLALCVALAMLVSGLWWFRRQNERLADRI